MFAAALFESIMHSLCLPQVTSSQGGFTVDHAGCGRLDLIYFRSFTMTMAMDGSESLPTAYCLKALDWTACKVACKVGSVAVCGALCAHWSGSTGCCIGTFNQSDYKILKGVFFQGAPALLRAGWILQQSLLNKLFVRHPLMQLEGD